MPGAPASTQALTASMTDGTLPPRELRIVATLLTLTDNRTIRARLSPRIVAPRRGSPPPSGGFAPRPAPRASPAAVARCRNTEPGGGRHRPASTRPTQVPTQPEESTEDLLCGRHADSAAPADIS